MKFKDALDNMPDPVKISGDGTSIGVVVATLTEILPAVAAVFSIVWMAIRIYETDTVQKLLRKKDK